MSDALGQLLLRRANALVLLLDGDGVVRDCSDALVARLGRDPDALVGRPFREALDPARGVMTERVEALLSAAGARAELPFRTERGRPAWLLLRASRLALDGEPRVVLFADDQSGHRAARSSDVKLAALAQELPGVLWTTDAKLEVTSITGGGLALRNRPRDELLGTTIEAYFGSDDPDFAPIAAHRRALAGRSGHYDFDREGRHFHARVDPLRATDGTIRGTVGLALEVTESRQLEGRLRRMQRERTLGRLAGSMAHEFNNLLTVIATHAVLLEDQLVSSDGREDLAAVREAASKGRVLTSRLLAFTSRQIQQPERVRVDRLLRELEPMLRAMVGERRRLSLHLDPGVGWVRIDPALLEQVVLSLVDNARQATEDGGRVTVRSAVVAGDRPGDARVQLCVADDGVGMSEVERSRACEPFFTTRASGAGSGLGLSTALAVVTEAGGRLTLDSVEGEGTEVRISLPRAKAPSGSFAVTVSRPSESVLLVEDQLGVRRAARRIMRRAGYEVFEAAHAEDALALSKAYPGTIHLLVTDVVMPGLSGPQLAERLIRERPELRVLYMSGYAEDVEEVRAALDRGQVFLAKPFTPEQLLRRLREALGEGVDEGDETGT
ncbi:MAG TPA: response regulator [Sandaracinaceae bacterium LLY-WYZ-13_1]|nr:response regulator [Sandaracinaceae bacterium LLY-WYZ-13_1]